MRTLPTTLLWIFCKIILNSKVIVKRFLISRRQFLEELLNINGLISSGSAVPIGSKQCKLCTYIYRVRLALNVNNMMRQFPLNLFPL